MSLFILTKALVNEKIEKEIPFCTFDICTKAIELHYQNYIGFCTLATTIHEKVTGGSLHIPIELVRGNYQYFIDNYSKYLDDDDKDTINMRLAYNLKNCSNEITWTKDDYPGLQLAA